MIKPHFLFLAALLFGSLGASASQLDEDVELVFARLPVVQFGEFCAEHVLKVPLSIGQDALDVNGVVSLRSGRVTSSKARGICLDVLSSHGLKLRERSGGVYELHAAVAESHAQWSQWIYVPRYRSAQELKDLGRVVVARGIFAGDRALGPVSGTVPEDGANVASMTTKVSDRLVFVGPPDEIEALSSLVQRLDTPRGQYTVCVAVVEYQRGSSKASAVQALGTLFGGHLSASIGDASGAGRIGVVGGGLEVALGLLDVDSRFRVVSRPEVLVIDGDKASFKAVEERRIVGAVVLDAKGNPVQSRETVSAGVGLEVSARGRDGGAEVDLSQDVSTFVTGQAQSDPVVLRRSARTSFFARFGTAIVLGGMVLEREEATASRFFGFRVGDAADQDAREVVLLVQVVSAS